MIRRHERPTPQPERKGIVRRKRKATPNAAVSSAPPQVKRRPRKNAALVGQRQRRRPMNAVQTASRRARSWVRTRWLPIAAAAVLTGVVAGAVWTWQSPLLRVREVEVVGAVTASERDIIERVDFWGERMLTVNFGSTERAITGIPLVASVEVERHWPGTVRITVHEREPWGSWEQAGLRYTIDREGYVLGHGAPPAQSATIVSNESFSLRPGDRIDHHAVDAAAAINEQIERALGTRAVELTYSPDDGIRVRTADGQTALLGDSSGIAYKLAVWARVAEEATAQNISYSTIDLRFGDRPVLR